MNHTIKKMAVILPHTKLYGGVKRFFELGEVFLKRGIDFTVFTPDGISPDWYKGSVQTVSLSAIQAFTFDAVFITEVQFIQQLVRAKSKRRILYFVRPSDNLNILKDFPEVEIFVNSTNGYEVAKVRYRIEPFKALGGININTFFPKVLKKDTPYFTVVTYGRIVERSKGTKLVVKACEVLHKKGYPVRLVLFDTPVNKKAELAVKQFTSVVPFEFVVNHPVEKNVELFHKGDVFVAAEKKTGYSNTAAEAMASGVPVIGTASGTKHFLIDKQTGIVVDRSVDAIANALELLMNDFDLRVKLAHQGRKKIEEFSWEALAEKIVSHIALPRERSQVVDTSILARIRLFLYQKKIIGFPTS